MSKRNTATKSKHSRGPKIAAKAQRVAQAVVRSPKDNRLRSVGAALTESLPERHNEQEALVGDPATAFNKRLPLSIRRQPYKMTAITIQRKDLIFLLPRQTCELFKQSCWRWHKPTCNLLLSSLRGLRRLGRPLNFSVSLQNSQASGAPCSGSIRKRWLN